MSNVCALIPVKSLHFAKSRLKQEMPSEKRSLLVQLMFRHVLGILQSVKEICTIIVITTDKKISAIADNSHVQVYHTPSYGHNRALRETAATIGSIPLLTISADIPLLTRQDICTIIEMLAKYEVILAPDKHQTGTNALLLSKPLLIPYTFGTDSLQSFQISARARQIRSYLYQSNSIAYDIDTADDIRLLKTYMPSFWHEIMS